MINRRKKRKILRRIKMLVVCVSALYLAVGVTKIYAQGNMHKSKEVVSDKVELQKENDAQKQETESDYISKVESRDWDAEDSYLLAKIAMAEAEGEDTEGKALVIMVVLNRVWSDGFPDTIREVIFQEKQFSPIQDGRWENVEPNEDCWKALQMIQEENWDESYGALYFESEGQSDWHRNNLEFLFKHGNHYFYSERS